MKRIRGQIIYPLFFLLAVNMAFMSCTSEMKKKPASDLAAGFRTPPDSVRPGVYWYFMDGNLSKEAMTGDLESMKEAGIGQVIFLEVNVGLPRGTVNFLSDEWQELFKYAVREAERLGIEITLGIGPGWTGSGGPWVKPEQSMMHLTASTLEVKGPMTYTGILPVPALYKPFFGEESVPDNLKVLRNKFYEDVIVLAFPTPANDIRLPDSDEKALYFRAPFSSQPGVKPFLPTSAHYADLPLDETIDRGKIIDITRFVQPDGHIHWDVPAGNWTIMRFGERNNGAVTRPAPEPGLGFECDKFDSVAFDAHFNQFVGKLLQKVEPRIKARHAGWTMLHMDSWEMSSQNWTGNFRKEFTRRRGYDPMPYLPAYLGRIVGSIEETERFLWDVRLTSQELVIENHAMRVKALARKYGMRLSIEPYDLNPCADFPLGAVADVPMCEFWSKGLGFSTAFSCFEAASLAHVQGLPVVASESFTAGFDEAWKLYPGAIKNQGDWAFCTGVNRFNYHTFAHKPYGDHLRPGMTMGPYGVHWDRGQTWWPMVNTYHTYISRCSYMLQQGHNIADILYLTPEGAPQVFLPPSSAVEGNDTIPDHKGYNFDGCSSDMLISKAEVKDGKIIFPGGASYSILVLPAIETMTPELLKKIETLIQDGAIVIGEPPQKSPSLVNYPECDKQVREMAEKIWGELPSAESISSHMLGKGRIYRDGKTAIAKGKDLYPGYETTSSILNELKMQEDFSSGGNELRFIHRSTGNKEIYFVSNRNDRNVKTIGRFRVEKGTPEIWDPLTGDIWPLSKFDRKDNEILVPMEFEPYQSYFVVFDKEGKSTTGGSENAAGFNELSAVTELQDNWTVTFDPTWGGPGKVKFDKLTDWSKNAEKGIRYFSGIAKYETTFNLPENFDAAKSGNIYLELSEVSNLARVIVNGKDLGVLWTFPWRVNITRAATKGTNQLTIEVANLWVNRLIGDSFMPYDGPVNNKWPEWLLKGKPRTSGRYTFTSYDYYKKDSPLLKSGLIGPVKIMVVKK
jgi:hypothetical protein